MITIIKWVTLWFYPDRCSLGELADRLSRRKKAASWWDHTHLTRRLATHKDAEEYKKLPPDKRHVPILLRPRVPTEPSSRMRNAPESLAARSLVKDLRRQLGFHEAFPPSWRPRSGGQRSLKR